MAVVRPDFAADAYVGQLWRVPLEGTGARRLSRGFRDTSPKFSPDGRLLAFLRAEPERSPQLLVMPAGGGEPVQVSDAKLGVRQFAFNAAGTRLAFVAPVPEAGRHGTTAGIAAGAEDPRHITSLQFQDNGTGFTADRRSQVFVVDVPDVYGEPPVVPIGRAADPEFRAVPPAVQLTSGDFDHHSPVWDGEAVVVVAARHEGRDRDLREDLYRFTLDGEPPVQLTGPSGTAGVIGSPVVVATEVAFVGGELGSDGLSCFGKNPGVFAVPLAGGVARRLTPESVSVTGELAADGDGVLGIDLVRGSGQVFRVGLTGDLERFEVPGSALAVGAAPGRRAAVVATSASPGELVDLERPGEPLTDFGAALREAAPVIEPRELVATAPDGYPVHGWAFVPAGAGPHPVLLLIHGGPFSAYGPSFFDEAQVLAGAGYAVMLCNPRGSAGYGEAHAQAIQGGFGTLDADDVLAFLDHALATVPGLDTARVGVMGGSYGGYLTAWLIAHTHRFAGAVVERAYLDGKSFVGASDIGWYFPQLSHGDLLDEQSPLLLTAQVQTPTLVIHSENDLRCPLAVALRYYTELKQRDLDCELLVFPGENHELSRSGTPHHRRARFEHILAWWARHLPVEVATIPDDSARVRTP